MEYSAGIAIIYKNKILLGHPSNVAMDRMWGIPKGKIEIGESKQDAASRETFEEIGIKIEPSLLKDDIEVIYKSKKGKTFKKVYYYVYKINSLSDIGLNSEELDKKQLQLEEIDSAKFMTKEEAEDIIFWRFKGMFKHLEE